MPAWRPAGSVHNLRQRARVLARAREFFAQRNVLEVETPLLGSYSVTEPNIQSFALPSCSRFLQTSPEYFMKRLLAAGSGDIYQISKAFRVGENGANHNSEFTLAEWYRLDFGLQQIMQETVEFISTLLEKDVSKEKVEYVTYKDALSKGLGVKEVSYEELAQMAEQHGLMQAQTYSQDQLYDFVFSQLVVPSWQADTITVVYHYPASQASLARLAKNDASVAERFEVFLQGKELANGFVELLDANEQIQRFERDQEIRRKDNLAAMEIDPHFIEALRSGLPACAGVAVGFDRVLMLALGSDSIRDVISFDWGRS